MPPPPSLFKQKKMLHANMLWKNRGFFHGISAPQPSFFLFAIGTSLVFLFNPLVQPCFQICCQRGVRRRDIAPTSPHGKWSVEDAICGIIGVPQSTWAYWERTGKYCRTGHFHQNGKRFWSLGRRTVANGEIGALGGFQGRDCRRTVKNNRNDHGLKRQFWWTKCLLERKGIRC